MLIQQNLRQNSLSFKSISSNCNYVYSSHKLSPTFYLLLSYHLLKYDFLLNSLSYWSKKQIKGRKVEFFTHHCSLAPMNISLVTVVKADFIVLSNFQQSSFSPYCSINTCFS